jgi:hypothetical protein
MLLHSLFYPEVMPVSDFSIFQPFVFTRKDIIPLIPPQISIESFLAEPGPGPVPELAQVESNKKQEDIPTIPEPILPENKKTQLIPTLTINYIKEKTICATNVQDGLFWSIYLAVYGETEYYRNKYNYGKIETQEKQKIADFMRSTGATKLSKMTNYKITRIGTVEIISDLTNTPHMPIPALIGSAAFYQRSIFLIDLFKKTCLVFEYRNLDLDLDLDLNPDKKLEKENPIILYQNPNYPLDTNPNKTTRTFAKMNEYFVDADVAVQSIEKIQETYHIIENYAKVLKGISVYKKSDLDAIANKIGMEISTISKTELYHQLLVFLAPTDKGPDKGEKVPDIGEKG